MRWRVFAKKPRQQSWRFVDATDSRRYADDLVQSYRDAGWMAFATNKEKQRDMRNNPSSAQIDMQRARKLYRGFTGRDADKLQRIPIPDFDQGGIVAGHLFEVRYISARDGKPYKHPFRVKSRPLLIATSDGKAVLIVGGRFAFTERGFVDK